MTSSYTVFQLLRPVEHVAELIFSTGKGNPMTVAFWAELPLAIAELAADAGVRAIVLRAEGAHFTYGLDLMGMGQTFMGAVLNGKLEGRQAIVEKGALLQDAFTAIARCPKPVIACVHGWCIGGGLELIAACDMRVASVEAKFALKEVKVGMVPDLGGIQRLPYIIGDGLLREMAITGCDVSAQRAFSIGLINSIHDAPEAAREAALALAGQVASNPPAVVAGIKQVMNARVEAAVAASLKEALHLNSSLMQSEDFKEAMMAFGQKRAAKFTGK